MDYKECAEAGERKDERRVFERTYRQILKIFTDPPGIQGLAGVPGSFDEARSRIYPKLVNAALNAEPLRTAPSVPFLDLAIVFYLKVAEDKETDAVTAVTGSLAKRWGASKETLYHEAFKNLRRDNPMKFGGMSSIFGGLAGADARGRESRQDKFYVVTSRDMSCGAVYLSAVNEMREAAGRIGSDFYILPSSIHEVLLVPAEDSSMMPELSAMVRSINEAEVSPEEVLSDHAYYCNHLIGEITW